MSQCNSSLGSTPGTRSGERILLSVLAVSGRSHVEGGEGALFWAGQLPFFCCALKIKALTVSGGLNPLTPRESGKTGCEAGEQEDGHSRANGFFPDSFPRIWWKTMAKKAHPHLRGDAHSRRDLLHKLSALPLLVLQNHPQI